MVAKYSIRKSEYKLNYLDKAYRHFMTICRHKYYVAKYCFMCGLYWQGITHDLSKFSPVEFFESVKYYTGTESPINVSKRANGWSAAWQHHKYNNKHHREYWTDNYDAGTTCINIPFKYMLEMVCDFLGAGQAYSTNQGKEFTIQSELAWWNSTKKKGIKIHDHSIWLIDRIFKDMEMSSIEKVLTDKQYISALQKEYEDKE